jgi:predicted negative regulator of RcsB-dependent stress response
MDEYLSEKEQLQWVTSQVKVYAPWAIAGVAIALLGVTGVRWWQARMEQQGFDASSRYQQVLGAFGRGDRARAMALLDELQRAHPGSPYVDQANLAAARVFVEANELDRAAQRLGEVATHSRDRELATIASLRLARVQIALGKPDAALASLGKEPGKAFASSYHEARGDAQYAKGDRAAALTEYQAARAAQGPGLAQNEQLTLKIDDLTQETTVSPTAPRAAQNGAGK